jgi:hypothetical protein
MLKPGRSPGCFKPPLFFFTETLFGLGTPRCAPEIQLGIDQQGMAVGTFSPGVVFPEFNHFATGGARLFKDIFGLPEPLILTRAFWHGWLSLEC